MDKIPGGPTRGNDFTQSRGLKISSSLDRNGVTITPPIRMSSPTLFQTPKYLGTHKMSRRALPMFVGVEESDFESPKAPRGQNLFCLTPPRSMFSLCPL